MVVSTVGIDTGRRTGLVAGVTHVDDDGFTQVDVGFLIGEATGELPSTLIGADVVSC